MYDKSIWRSILIRCIAHLLGWSYVFIHIFVSFEILCFFFFLLFSILRNYKTKHQIVNTSILFHNIRMLLIINKNTFITMIIVYYNATLTFIKCYKVLLWKKQIHSHIYFIEVESNQVSHYSDTLEHTRINRTMSHINSPIDYYQWTKKKKWDQTNKNEIKMKLCECMRKRKRNRWCWMWGSKRLNESEQVSIQ